MVLISRYLPTNIWADKILGTNPEGGVGREPTKALRIVRCRIFPQGKDSKVKVAAKQIRKDGFRYVIACPPGQLPGTKQASTLISIVGS
jgi:hypothetical protein